MTDLGSISWPPAPIVTQRLLLRQSEARDRSAFVDLLTSSDVRAYLGGPLPRAEVEHTLPDVPGRRPGIFVIDLDGALIGLVEFDRRDPERPGHLRPGGHEAELSYLLLPTAWGHGYAVEACSAALDWFADSLPGEPVVLCTQTANHASMRLAAKLGFSELDQFEEYGARQWFGTWSPAAPSRSPGKEGPAAHETDAHARHYRHQEAAKE